MEWNELEQNFSQEATLFFQHIISITIIIDCNIYCVMYIVAYMYNKIERNEAIQR